MSLKVVNLSKRYNDKWVLRDVSFEIEGGEVYGIFGPTASGKSTLLHAVLGSTSLNGGSVLFRDKDITKLSRGDRDFNALEMEGSSIWQRILKSANAVSKSERALQQVHKTIESAQTVLILDDPFGGLDASECETLVEKIRDAAKDRGLSVVIASSDFDQILRTCDRAAVIVNGEIRQIGTPKDIYEKPESRIVASVVGRNNLFAARRLSSSKAEIPEFHTIDGSHRLFAQRIERGMLGALNQNVTLAIRPEQVSISFGASFPEDNLVKATVERIQFMGASTMIELDADGLKLKALVLRVVGLNVGDECMVGLPPDRIQIFRD